MTSVLILTHDNLEMTKRCFESVRRQSVAPSVLIYDNGSSDGTVQWLKENKHPATFDYQDFMTNLGVSKGWNCGLYELFHNRSAEHVLVIGNDTVIPPDFYHKLLSYNRPLISGTETTKLHELDAAWPDIVFENTVDFGAFLIRRDCWDTVGLFDEAMVSWASDCDYHARAHKAGIVAARANVPYYHERSSTIRLAAPKEKRKLELQADADRQVFYEKWGCLPGTPEYAELFK